MKKKIKDNQRKLYILFSFLFLVVFSVTFSLTYGQRNDPSIVFIDDKLNGVIENVVHINDLNADYYYYKGMNFTNSGDGSLPTINDKNVYPDNRLVEVQITYSGFDPNSGYRGYVSLGELQDTFIYYKVFPVNDNGTPSNLSDDYIEIELIENPFTNRPTNRGFNGWKTSYSGAEISLDRSYYIRYAKVPVSYSGQKPNKVEINFNATWIPASVSLVNSSRTWATAFNDLDTVGMKSVQTVVGQTPLPLNMNGYFREVTVNYNQSYIGYYDGGGNIIEDPSNPSFCVEWFVPVGAEYYNASGTLQITQAGSGTICSKAGMIVFKDDTTYSNIATSGGQFNVLVVAGGGSGARSSNTSAGGGGGGAGGLILREELYIESGNQTLTVGSGGIANPSSERNNGRNGDDTIAFGLQAIGGGGGGATSNGLTGLTGGSGGGGGARNGSGGSGTSGQGSNGGNGSPANTGDNGGGGGGGFSQVGGVGTTNGSGGAGGNGFNGSSLFGTSVGENGWFAGGGAGGISGSRTMGLGGLGGGGNGGIGTTAGQSAMANTGGGGGGSPRSNFGAGNGGSGVVIVQWDESIQTRICDNVNGCTFYEVIGNEYYNSSLTYYEVVNGRLEEVNPDNLPFEYEPTYSDDFTPSSNMSTFFRLINIPRFSSVEGYYDNLGNVQSGTCSTIGGCNLYELIQYRNSSNQLETINQYETYYYLPTRDTNIIVMTTNLSNTWGTAQTKPFTLTSVHNGVDYRGSVLWTVNLAVNTYGDTNIENIRMTTTEAANNTTPPSSGTTTTRNFYGRWNNIRFGRGITQNGTQTNFRTIIGGANAATGSSSNITKYRVIVESGRYSTFSLGNSGGTANTYIENKAIYGNDYDRVTQNNNNLYVNFVASGSWGGNVYSSSNTAPIFDLVVKSGEFGGGRSDHTTGIYVGGRGGGTHYGPRVAKIEGGWIYNLIGGPLTASTKGNLNDSLIYMTGGEVDVIIGGAGTSATFGHRIIQVTGGRVNYSVFGGSNGYDGSGTDGTVRGSSYIYIGGLGVIGNPTLVANNSSLWGAEAGSVFGIGNGRSGFASIGSSDNSNIVVQDEAVINGNIYGGGNFGATGISSGTNSTYSNIKLIGGTIKKDVYGGGNNNGAGNASVSATINIDLLGSDVEGNIYGGSNTLGTIFGDVNLNIVEGTVDSNIYGGGKGGYLNSSNPGTYVRNNVVISVGNASVGPTILGNIYGGSAYGSVNTISQSTAQSSDGITLNINNGTIGEDIYGGAKGDSTYSPNVAGTINLNFNDGTVTGDIYGGNDANGSIFRTSTVYLNGGTARNVYGGGNQVGISSTDVRLQGSSVNRIYGGSNLSGNVNTTNIVSSSGTVDYIFGGNNEGGYVNATTLNITGGNINNAFGGGRFANVGSTNMTISGSVTNIYGGGQNADVSSGTTINISGGTHQNVYGGSNQAGTVPTSNITITNGNISNLFGGNNQGGQTNNTTVNISGGTHGSVYGGGRLANSVSTSLTVGNANTTNIYGGGQDADVTSGTTININGGTHGSVYGGSNQAGIVPTSNITITNGNISSLYGGNNEGGQTNNTTLTISGGTHGSVYGGGRLANATSTSLTIGNATTTNIYGGGQNADVTSSTTLTINGGTHGSVYGGSNQAGIVPTSNITVTSGNITNLYGGNNQGGQTNNTVLNMSGGTHGSVYGGGRLANTTSTSLTIGNATTTNIYGGGQSADVVSGTTLNISGGIHGIVYGGSNQSGTVGSTVLNVSNTTINQLYGGNNEGGTTLNTTLEIDNSNIGDIYGGGNTANVLNNTSLVIENSEVSGFVFGGGNNAPVLGNSLVRVDDTSILESVYAGGNGQLAVVHGDTTVYVEGNTVIDNHLFGGGNAANTGVLGSNNSVGTVVVSGGTIGGNVYGGANTAVLYGTANVYIGYGYTGITLDEKNILIEGTVFGGGEANAAGDENYDFSFISVTNGITINIIGDQVRNLRILGSIFGSGNASSTTGYSSINIENYGSIMTPNRNISIQRANLLTIENSHIELFGATDRTNEYSSTLFSISRIKEMKLKNNSIVYFENGANLLEKVTSIYESGGNEQKSYVTIDENGNYVRNVDNRLYMLEGKNLNIATNESITAYGEVSGMMFFGMYNRDRDGNVDTAFYSPNYGFGDEVLVGQFYHFSSGSYVLGRHNLNHNINIDGFYTYEENEDNPNTIRATYINPIPEDANYYMWVVGESIASYDISLTASKFSTLGTYELPLLNFNTANTRFTVVGVNFNELDPNFQLVRKSQVPRISSDGTADTKMSLVMQASNTGWITVGETNFLTEEVNPLFGTTDYLSENSNIVPTLLFYIYHSKNLSSSGSIGTVTISLLAATPIDDLNYDVERININIDLSRVLYTAIDYEGAMTPGEKHSVFVSTLADITTDSKISAYYSLFTESETPFYATGDYRALVSTTIFPENTKLTLIDLVPQTPVYYYYVVSAADVIAAQNEFAIHNEASYPFSRFIRMGSTSSGNNYDDAIQNDLYYDSDTDIVHEEFIVIADFGESNISSNKLNETLLIELRGSQNQTKMTVLGIQHANLTYSLYTNKATIQVNSVLSKSDIYMGEKVNLDLSTNFVQAIINSRIIHDTTFYDKKMGVRITFVDQNDNVMSGGSLFGLRLRYNGIYYYPQLDGSFRINLSPRVANVFSRIEIDTQNANLPSGLYKVRTESYASADGLYFGLNVSASDEVNLNVQNNIYGLKVNINNRAIIIDKDTGITNLGNNIIVVNAEFSSALANPKFRITMKRRDYNNVYSNVYTPVNFENYFTNTLTRVGAFNNHQFILENNPTSNQNYFLTLKNNLVSGTYQISFQVYDGNNFIGEVYKYVIIK